ncbi:hypothetical protein HMSSN036_88290 [Paenibacillus macerans]|nr:hypothetical protein HMSSN036_88290 [Paenibacillus macerans]
MLIKYATPILSKARIRKIARQFSHSAMAMPSGIPKIIALLKPRTTVPIALPIFPGGRFGGRAKHDDKKDT